MLVKKEGKTDDENNIETNNQVIKLRVFGQITTS